MSLRRMLFLLFPPLLLLPRTALARDVDGATDHPLVPRYAATGIRDYSTNAFDEFLLISGPSKPNGSL